MARRESRRPALDWALLLTMVPAFLVVLGLHVAQLGTTGGARPPVYVVPQAGSPYPMVGGVRAGGETELRRGDRIVSAAGHDLGGANYFRFDAIVLAAAASDPDVPIVFERNGERKETRFEITPRGFASYRLPALLSLAVVAVLVLLRSPGTAEGRNIFTAFMAMAIFEMPFAGAVWQSYAYNAIFLLVGQFAVFRLLWLVVQFPREIPEAKRAPAGLVWIGLIFWIARIPYVTGLGLPPVWLPTWTVAADVLLFATGIAIFLHNFRCAEPLGRRRAKWVLLGFLAPAVPMILAIGSSALDLPPLTYRVLFQTAALLGPALPLGILVSIQREGLLDIDRLLPAAASYTLALITAVGAGFAAVPLLGGAVAETFGVGARTGHLLVAAGLATVAVPLGARLRPVLDDYFFPERHTMERGFGALLRDLGDCGSRAEVLALLQARIRELLLLEHATLFVPRGEGDRDVFAASQGVAARFGGDAALVRALERDPVPMVPSARELRMRVPDLSPDEAQMLLDLDANVLLPVRRGKDLAAFLLLGPKVSGDLFPATELAFLGAAAEKASAELLRLRESEAARSERQRADELRELKEAAEAANQAKTRFLAAASHDLRQPLHALQLFVHRLAQRMGAGDQGDLVGQIERSTAALAHQFDTLLDLSRLEAGAVEPQPRAYEIGPELARLAGEWSEAASAKGLALRFDPVEATVESDPVLLNRIIGNLLSNAVRYTGSGEVHLRTSRRGGLLAIEVADTGPGIPRTRQREIFGEFVQLAHQSRGEGLGLGLSIVDRTARLLGHEIEIESEEGRGSVFRVLVPCASSAATMPQLHSLPPVRRQHGADLGSARILVVDDDPAVVEAMAGLLASWGCDVIEAESVRGALAALSRAGEVDAPFLILADYRLGDDENGIDVIQAVRQRMGRDVPAVIVSGEAQPRTLSDIRASGHHCLTKPVSPAKLRALLSELLRSPEDVEH